MRAEGLDDKQPQVASSSPDVLGRIVEGLPQETHVPTQNTGRETKLTFCFGLIRLFKHE